MFVGVFVCVCVCMSGYANLHSCNYSIKILHSILIWKGPGHRLCFIRFGPADQNGFLEAQLRKGF